MDPLQPILERAKRDLKRIVFPESDDPRVRRAVSTLAEQRVVTPIVLDARQQVWPAGVEADGDGASREDREAVSEVLAGTLQAGELEQLLAQPLYLAAAMVRAGRADGMVAGAVHATSETMRAALRIIRPANEAQLVSSFFLMALREPTPGGETVLAFADCGLLPDPDADQLAEIAKQTAASYRLLVEREPKVALLSFSTKGSAQHEAVDRVRGAVERLAAAAVDFPFDGELQLDAALIPDVARAKAPGSPVAGSANVLIFPNLDAGNIGYKLVERLGGARAIGPLLQGLSRPANDLSRGCAVEDIVVAAAVTAVQAQQIPRHRG